MHTIGSGWTRLVWLGFGLALASCGSMPEELRSADDAGEATEVHEEAGIALLAANVLSDATTGTDHEIPRSLLERARGIVVVPNVMKAALGLGGRWGRGLAVQRTADGGWSAPAYVTLGGASYGFQIGAQSTDLVLVFTGDDGLKALIDDRLKLGADVSIAAGPVGRNVELGTNLSMDSAILSYSRTEGLFAGAALEGAVLEFDVDRNHEIYGPRVGAAELLSGGVDPAPAVEPFARAVEAHTPASGAS
jgi:lipid-binding SYLF domain-containing protein